MDEATLKRWQALHRRFASGETLTSEEQAVYQAGCDELDASEKIGGQEEIERLKAHLKALEQERTLLLEQRRQQEGFFRFGGRKKGDRRRISELDHQEITYPESKAKDAHTQSTLS